MELVASSHQQIIDARALFGRLHLCYKVMVKVLTLDDQIYAPLGCTTNSRRMKSGRHIHNGLHDSSCMSRKMTRFTAQYVIVIIYLCTSDGSGQRIEKDGKACICKMPYNPWNDSQVYCTICKTWYHQDCIKKVGRQALEFDKNDIVGHILGLSIQRGYGGNAQDLHDLTIRERNWHVIGLLRLHQYCSILQSNREKTLPPDWQDVIPIG